MRYNSGHHHRQCLYKGHICLYKDRARICGMLCLYKDHLGWVLPCWRPLPAAVSGHWDWLCVEQEVEHLQHLEETTLSSDLAQGYALKALTELLWLFVEHDRIKNFYKTKLVGFILNGYLSLRKLVVQRTKLIDETQERLLELLEELTTGRSCVFWGKEV